MTSETLLKKVKYIKLREDEYNLMKKYYDSEENVSTVRRVQTLSPKIDFDWVFSPFFASRSGATSSRV